MVLRGTVDFALMAQRSGLERLLPMLRCPECGASLSAEDERELICAAGHRYPLHGGIPRFTPPSTYADSFGYQWTTFRRTQLDDSVRDESEATFAEKTGLEPGDVKGRAVLDVGCGMGRFADVVARWGAETVVGMDLSRAVEAAAENLEQYEGAHVVQADAFAPPFAPASFDLVFSIGVLHHTPSTVRAVASAARFVKPGGTLAVWLYGRHLRLTHLGSEILRPVTSRIPQERLLRMVRWTVPKMDRLHEHAGPLSKPLRVALPTSGHPDPEWRILDTFDWYSPRYQWKHANEEVTEWFRRLGFTDLWVGPVPVSVRGRRPQ
jgi:SAM-dependent methyltransferase